MHGEPGSCQLCYDYNLRRHSLPSQDFARVQHFQLNNSIKWTPATRPCMHHQCQSAQSPSSHGQLPADISDVIPEKGLSAPHQMLKLFVLVIKLNFIVTLSSCYCTTSNSAGLNFIIAAVYLISKAQPLQISEL